FDSGKSDEDIMVGMNWKYPETLLRIGVLAVGIAAALPLAATPTFAAEIEQKTFASPEQAVAELVAADRSGDTAGLESIFGPDGKKLIDSGDPVADKQWREKFVAAYEKRNGIENEGDDKAILIVGEHDWPYPIPIVKQGESWRFDTKAGAEAILDRRIGRNELNTIEVCRAYVDAQREYAAKDRDGSGLPEYAQRFLSSPGKHDGLYWETGPGEAQSPLGPLVARASAEGYDTSGKHVPYHGYYFKILKQQGTNARGGGYLYIADGHMIGGFALVAYPAQYGVSGVMTFMVNQDGVIYQKNFGPDTATIAEQIDAFDPDETWKTP
ncbi:MAG: DUF2950 domain-containing protein, partial [Alphaproteobacteria bacterium]